MALEVTAAEHTDLYRRVRAQVIHDLVMSPDLWRPAESLDDALGIVETIVRRSFERQDFR